MTKLQLTLTDQETDLLAAKAVLLGYDVTRYVKFLIGREAMTAMNDYPVYHLTEAMEKKVIKAIKDNNEGKSIEL
ncbi:MAG: hypothetical protein ABH807_01110, partial [Candidatus Shapirobacteria bacterium]